MDIVSQRIRGGLSVKEAMEHLSKQFNTRIRQDLTRDTKKVGGMTIASIRPVPKKDVKR